MRAFEVLNRWVENGSAPETLPLTFTGATGEAFMSLCAHTHRIRSGNLEVGDNKSNPDASITHNPTSTHLPEVNRIEFLTVVA